MAAWPHVPWGAVRRRLPYASQGKEPPLIPYAHRGTLLSAERHWIGVLPWTSTPIGLGCTERALRGALPAEQPYVDAGEGSYGDASPSPLAARRSGGSHWGAPASSSRGAAVDTAAARGAAPPTRGGESQRSDPLLKRRGDRGWGTTVKWLSGLSWCVCVRTCFVGCPKDRPPLPTESTSQIVPTGPSAPPSLAHIDAHALAPNRITHQIKSH